MKIVAISGGKYFNKGGNAIDKEIIRLSDKPRPKILFIPTASEHPGSSNMDSVSYYKMFREHFERKLNCKTDVLYLVREKPSMQEIRSKILDSDIIYVGGGSTMRMIRVWKRRGVDRILREAMKKNKVLTGISAGAICWFDYGQSKEIGFKKTEGVIKLKGLGFLPGLASPHYNHQAYRKPTLEKMLKKYGGIAIALEALAAIEVIDDKYRIVSNLKKANVYKVYVKKGKIVEEDLPKDGKFRPLSDLTERQRQR